MQRGEPSHKRRGGGSAAQHDPFVLSVECWDWLKELRFRFEFDVEIFSIDLVPVLPTSAVARAADIREACRTDALVRDAISATLRTGKARSIVAGDLRIRLAPLRRAALARPVIGCLAVGDVFRTPEQSPGSIQDLDRRLDLASQWLAPAIEATVDAAGSSIDASHAAQRFQSMLEVVHGFGDVTEDRELVQLMMEALALWFDADVRVYRQDGSGAFVLEAWLPGASEEDRPAELPDYRAWDVEEVLSVESLQDVEGFTWDARLAGVLLAPVHVGGSPEWLLMVSGSTDPSIRSILAFLCRSAGLTLAQRGVAAQDRLRVRVEAMLATGDPPFAEMVRLALEAAGREIGATAARLSLHLDSPTPALTIGWGRSDSEAPPHVEPGSMTTTAHDIAIGVRVRTGVTAVLEFHRLDREFSTADVRLAPAAASQMGGWLAGVFWTRTDGPLVGGSETRTSPSRDVRRAVRSAQGRAVVAVLVDTAGVGLGSILRELELHLRASDVVIGLPRHGAAALLQALDPAAVTAVAARLLHATQERFRIPVRTGVAMSDISSDSPEAVIERAIASAKGGEATI